MARIIKIDPLSNFSKKFTIGKQTEIDIPNELIGIMPDSKWKINKKGEKWQKGETLNTVIGQGFTALNATTNNFNDGYYCKRKKNYS